MSAPDAVLEMGERGSSSLVLDRERLEGLDESSVSVSEPLRSTSSQESATGLDFGFAAGFWGDLALILRCESVSATSVVRVRIWAWFNCYLGVWSL